MNNISENNSKRFGQICLAVSACAFLIVYTAILNTICEVELKDILLFFVSQLVFVLLPGMCVTLYVNPGKSAVRYLIISYMLGIGIMIAQSFIYGALHLTSGSLIGMIIVSALSITGIFKKRNIFFDLFNTVRVSEGFSLFGLTAAILLITALFGITVYKTPDMNPSQLTYIYHDLLWNIGNTVSLANGLPVEDVHVSGFTFGYHYFINAFLAPFYNTLDISAFTLFIKLLPTVSSIVLAGGFFIFIGSLFKNPILAALFSILALLCSTFTLTQLLWYAYATSISMGMGLAAAHYFIKLYKKFDTVKLSDRDFIIFLLLLTIATGIKTLLAAAVIAGAGITILAQIFVKKTNIKNMLGMGISIVAVVTVIYFALIYGTHAFNGLSRSFASMMWMGNPPRYYTQALANFPNLPILLIRLMTYPIFLIRCFPLFVVSTILLFICLLRKVGDFYTLLFLLSGIIVGFGAASVIYQPGLSNTYFAEGALPLCTYSLLFIIINCSLKKWARVLFTAIATPTLIYSAYFNIDMIYTDYTHALPHRAITSSGSPYDSINAGQYEGMLWLKENTDRGDIFATDHIYYMPGDAIGDARYYYYTAFSERPSYLEGYNYISTHTPNYEKVLSDKIKVLNRAFLNDGNAFKELYEDGVRYFVVTRFIHPDFSLYEGYGEEVFSNDDITIYRLYDVNS